MSVAIIAEYNPFHNGHIYQLKEAKKRFPDEEIVIVMSGKYVQRGELAITDFEERKKIALANGADQVIELPFKYATQAAHIFAEGAIKIVNKHNINKIFFGSESNDPESLMLIANTIFSREAEYNLNLKTFLKMGYSFPASSAAALSKLIGRPITLPNDILGLEYCKAIVKNKFKIDIHTIQRTVGFHSEVPNQEFASASYIRELIRNNQPYNKYTPMKIKDPLDIRKQYPQFQKIVQETPKEELAKIHLISEGMENLFKKHIDAGNYDEFVNRTNSRRYTSSRIKRVMLYVLLQIKKDDLNKK